MKIHVLAFSGSVRKESYTTRIIHAFKERAPEGVNLDLMEIGSLPFINEDLEMDLPQPVKDLHARILKADAVLFATPEYNRSYSPIIKNAIDWGSRPIGNNCWDGKPAAVIGCSLYTLGAFGAVNHLRQVMMYVNLQTLAQPEFYLSKVAASLDEHGTLTSNETQQHIDEFWQAFLSWIKKHR